MKPQSEWTNIDYMEEGRRQERRDLIEWLNEYCDDDHSGYQVKDGIKTIIGKAHRKDCSFCWAKLQPSGLSKLMGKFPDL